MKYLGFVLVTTGLVITSAFADSATWKASPISNNWNDSQDWTPEIVPSGLDSHATFDSSNITNLVASVAVDSVSFTQAANAFVLTIPAGGNFRLTGSGVTNNSASLQQFDVQANGAAAGILDFTGNSSAGALTLIRVRGGNVDYDYGGLVRFYDTASVGSAHFVVEGGTVNYALNGRVEIYSSATDASGTFVVNGGSAVVARGGSVTFRYSSSAGHASYINNGGASRQGSGGLITFFEDSTAASATLSTEPSYPGSVGGTIAFYDTASAGSAVITNVGVTSVAPGDQQSVGQVTFDGNSTAASSTIVNEGGAFDFGISRYGVTYFRGSATAAQATITNRAATISAGIGGKTYCSAAQLDHAIVINEGAVMGNAGGGALTISGSSTTGSGSPTITNRGASTSTGGSGSTTIDSTNAGQAVIVNESGTKGAPGGTVQFIANSSSPDAASATIINKAPVSTGPGGVTTFTAGSAGTATITAEGSAVAADSAVLFQNQSTANGSTITLLGATAANGLAGRLQFGGASSAGHAIITAKSGSGANFPGGRIIFNGQATGGTARVTIEPAGRLDVSGLTSASAAIGSIEGGGDVFLGSRNLAAGSNNLNTEFAGVIHDGGLVSGSGGSVTKTGNGRLTLSGQNVYTGLTTVSVGALCLTGSVAGNVSVSSGGTLCLAGGTLGSNVTISANATLSGFGIVKGSFTNNGLVLDGDGATITLAGAVTNNGVMRVTRNGVLDASSASSFTNNGTLDLISGFASLPVNFSNGPNGVVLDSTSVRVRGVTRGANQMTLTIDSYSGHTYQLQRSPTLGLGAIFENVGPPQAGNTGMILSFVCDIAGGQSFYRVGVD